MKYDYSIYILECRLQELSADYQRVLDLNRNSALLESNLDALESIKNRMVDVEKSIRILTELGV